MNLDQFIHHAPAAAPNYWLFGIEHRILIARDDVSVMHICAPPGTGTPPHIHHREEETFLILAGQGIANYNGTEVDLLPGTTILLPRGIPHFFTSTGEEALQMHVVLTPGYFARCFMEYGILMDTEFVAPPLGPPPAHVLNGFANNYGIEFLGP